MVNEPGASPVVCSEGAPAPPSATSEVVEETLTDAVGEMVVDAVGETESDSVVTAAD